MVQARATTAAGSPRSSSSAVAAIRAASLAAFASTVLLATTTTAHPLCMYGPDRAVSMNAEPKFCPNHDEGFCCEPDEDAAVKVDYDAAGVSEGCLDIYKEVVCGVCNPYSAHLYTRLGDGLAMTADFCEDFVTACGDDLALSGTYCDEHVHGDNEYWSFPFELDASFSDSDVNPAFPDLDESILPPEPIAMHMTPDGTAWWIAGMAGYIKQASTGSPDDAFDVLDISGKIEHSYEQGLMGFAFSPSFSRTGLFYVSYTIPGERNPENAKNVLSKFIYHEGDLDRTYDSEEELIVTSEKSSTVHSSGWVGFAPSSYKDPTGDYHDLYWTVGDGGPQNDPDNRAQDPSEYHGSVVRISVPSYVPDSPSTSGDTDTGYEIPIGNAFDGSDGARREICAWGFRNPFRCGFDRETDELYCGDVGQDAVEEVDIVECGKDYGWRMYEGDRCNDGYDGANGCSDLDRGDYAFPTFQYCHFDYDSGSDEYDVCGDRTVTGLSVIGGYVYRGLRYADVLAGHYIFADHSTGVLHHLAPSSGGGWTAGIMLSSIPKVSGFAEDNDGEIYLIGYQGNIYDLPCGSLCDSHGEGAEVSALSSCMEQSDSVPTYEEVGCFADGSPRAMTLGQAPGCDSMNAEMCASYCATLEGAKYFAMEYQRECYCSADKEEYDEYGEIDESECNMPCSGYPDEKCGGDGTMNVYAITGDGSGEAGGYVVPVPTAENYLGCFGDDVDDRALTHGSRLKDTGMTVEMCHTHCSEIEDSTIFGLEFGYECYCGTDQSDFEYHGEVDTCDLPCLGDEATACGGWLSMSVYTMEGVVDFVDSSGTDDWGRESIIVWYDSFFSDLDDDGSEDDGDNYQGCYTDERGEMRAMKTKVAASDNMTVAKCRAFCQDSSIFGLEYGDECWCGDGDSLDAEKKLKDEECDYPCAGDPDSTCGGFWRIAVYESG